MSDTVTDLRTHLALALLAHGQVPSAAWVDRALIGAVSGVVMRLRQRAGAATCGIDRRIADFLRGCLGADAPALPACLELDRPGLARMIALPHDGDHYANAYLSSWRVRQGVLHNPASDKRTTSRSFHIAEHGPAAPADKLALPPRAFARLLARALAPPAELRALPWDPSCVGMLGLRLRPIVAPALPGRGERRMEVRAIAPGGLAASLDFIEHVFGHGGDAADDGDDAALDPDWSGHTGLIVFAPHVIGMHKVDLGLPSRADASERQRRDGMCWDTPDEPYHGGKAFKATLRDPSGCMVTILADSYFGYGKKEVKTMLSFAANLSGGCEEEHAGGALCFARWHLGDRFSGRQRSVAVGGHTFAEALTALGERARALPEGHAVDATYADVLYVPEDVVVDTLARTVTWGDANASLPLRADATYVLPSGYRVEWKRHPRGGEAPWRLVGTQANGVFIHRLATVSGGGKSEIAKPIDGAIIHAPIYVADLASDLTAAADVIAADHGGRFSRTPAQPDRRAILSPERSLGSVIKLLTPSAEYSPAHNDMLGAIPDRVRALVYLVKRLWRPDWGHAWRERFQVDLVNGVPGHELKCEGRALIGSYLRIGNGRDDAWRTFKLRQDFVPSAKLQLEDDITASAVAPAAALGLTGDGSRKVVRNCEKMLFQRPDDAIDPGVDRVAEADIAGREVFLSNYEPIATDALRDLVADAPAMDRYSEPMRSFLEAAAAAGSPWTVSSAHPRLIAGKPSSNPRYLQIRPDDADPRGSHLADICQRLARRWPADRPLTVPVDVLLVGRRNNSPDRAAGIAQLAVYNPLHWQDAPELLADLIASLSGTSPSTTGAGSEGALTKAPFNALPAVYDLNTAVVSLALTRLAGFSSPAGHVGPNMRVDHDFSQLWPELFCRMSPAERDPRSMIASGDLERVAEAVPDAPGADRLGWRITAGFVARYLGRIVDSPHAAIDAALLQPETQDRDAFADGCRAIRAAQMRVAQAYIDDGSIDLAVPPLAVLLRAMAAGDAFTDPDLHGAFTMASVLASDWYQARLKAQQAADVRGWKRRARQLAALGEVARTARLHAERMVDEARGEAWRAALAGTVGLDPSLAAGEMTAEA